MNCCGRLESLSRHKLAMWEFLFMQPQKVISFFLKKNRPAVVEITWYHSTRSRNNFCFYDKPMGNTAAASWWAARAVLMKVHVASMSTLSETSRYSGMTKLITYSATSHAAVRRGPKRKKKIWWKSMLLPCELCWPKRFSLPSTDVKLSVNSAMTGGDIHEHVNPKSCAERSLSHTHKHAHT